MLNEFRVKRPEKARDRLLIPQPATLALAPQKKIRRRHDAGAGLQYSRRELLFRRRLLVVALVCQFVVDQLFELWRRLRTRQRPAVDEERRGSVHTDFL